MNLTKSLIILNPSPYRYRYQKLHCTSGTGTGTGDNISTTSTEQTNNSTKPKKKKLKLKRLRQEEKIRELASSSPEELKRKKWEKMSLKEKAIELYLGEKGILFWVNKLAYASIFGVIGIWILFRFVGPSLGLYQLDQPLLPPSKIIGK